MVIGRANIDLADDARSVLLPADVDHRRGQKDAGQHDTIDAAACVERGEAIDYQQHDQRSDQRFCDRAPAAPKCDPAEHRGSQHDNLETDADVSADGAKARSKEKRADGRQPAAGNVTKCNRAPDRDTRIIGRASRTAYGGDVPTGTQAGQEDMAENRHHNVEQRNTRYAEYRAVAKEIPGRKVRKCGGDVVRITLDQQVVGRTVDDQRDQRRYEGAQAQIADQDAVHGSQRQPADDGRKCDQRHRPAEHVKREECAKVG